MLNAGDMEQMGNLGNGADSASNIPVDVHTSSTDTAALSGIAAIGGLCALTDGWKRQMLGAWKLWTLGQWGNY